MNGMRASNPRSFAVPPSRTGPSTLAGPTVHWTEDRKEARRPASSLGETGPETGYHFLERHGGIRSLAMILQTFFHQRLVFS